MKKTSLAWIVALFTLVTSTVLFAQFPSGGASIALMRVMLTGGTHNAPIPAYLKFGYYSTTQAGVQLKTSPGVLGCVMINQAGAAGSLISLYNATAAVTGYEIAIIDATQVGRTFCYGTIFSGMLWVKITSGGAAPNVTISYR